MLIKGPSVTRGYFNNPEQTAQLFDAQGYLHTGDIGHILPNGTLKIIDRKKHIFKLAQVRFSTFGVLIVRSLKSFVNSKISPDLT